MCPDVLVFSRLMLLLIIEACPPPILGLRVRRCLQHWKLISKAAPRTMLLGRGTHPAMSALPAPPDELPVASVE